jgi:hypothetical protein
MYHQCFVHCHPVTQWKEPPGLLASHLPIEAPPGRGFIGATRWSLCPLPRDCARHFLMWRTAGDLRGHGVLKQTSFWGQYRRELRRIKLGACVLVVCALHVPGPSSLLWGAQRILKGDRGMASAGRACPVPGCLTCKQPGAQKGLDFWPVSFPSPTHLRQSGSLQCPFPQSLACVPPIQLRGTRQHGLHLGIVWAAAV